ncbi:MAG: hypothetical protein LBD41_02570 [Clostridiales Family XIII bacterium]|nr:hypothetical protein [Clostridiales Family XIII bacterium]
MIEEKISGEELKDLMDNFVDDVILQKSKWVGMEMPPLHRMFPHNVRELFMLWYNIGKNTKVKLILDISEFHKLFTQRLKSKKITCKLKEFKSSYNREYGAYKYIFNNLRLTCFGLYLYLNILPDIKNENSAYSYARKLTKVT